jgi:hypothetical protein
MNLFMSYFPGAAGAGVLPISVLSKAIVLGLLTGG